MRRKFLIDFQSITRWFLLTSVLTGIFFSSGEGLQLFPFPASFDSTGKDSSYNQEVGNKSYADSLHNFNNYSLSTKSKFQKNIKNDFVCWSLSANKLPLKKLFILFSKTEQVESRFFYSYNFFVSSPGRAPPIV